MKNFEILVDAFNYIENNLCENITQDDIANACYCSLSTLQKIWKYSTHTSLKEYISKRRLTLAARDITTTEMSIVDIAMKYGYNSHEVFTRAFTKLWGVAPSKFKSEWRFTGLFPKIIPSETINYGGNTMNVRNVDISELYDVLKSMTDTYVLSFDMVGLMPINDNYGRIAGDAAIRECLKRLDTAADENMLVFRIGGDEFAVVTAISDHVQLEDFANTILEHNGKKITADGHTFPVSMRCGATKITDSHFNYEGLFTTLQKSIDFTRDAGQQFKIN